MPKDLSWCVGKFAYPHGSDKPINFMELKDFMLDDAFDFSHLFLVRTMRRSVIAEEFSDEGLKSFIERDDASELASAGAKLLKQIADRSGKRPVVSEVYPGVGVTYEYMKLMWERDGREPFTYHGIGESAYGRKFITVQAVDQDWRDFSYAEVDTISIHNIEEMSERSDLLIINLNRHFRSEAAATIDAGACLAVMKSSVLVSVRVSESDEEVIRTTIKGIERRLPALSQIIESFLATGAPWRFKYLPGFDEGFMLPGANERAGILLAYVAPGQVEVAGFSETVKFSN
ncbi:MAG TPA: hypothetical protein ENI77_03820 [Nitrospirae bacterium]|nr:hypothetical protein [Nitrospirota bacterium]